MQKSVLALILILLIGAVGIVVFVDTSIEDTSHNDGVITLCGDDDRGLFCTADYTPVCGLVRVECIRAPCNPIPETFSNACTACSNSRVISYTNGACETVTP